MIDEILVAVPALPETEVTLEFNNVESEVKLVPPRATDKIPVVPATIGSPVILVAVPLAGVPNTGVVKTGLVKVLLVRV